HWLPLAPSAIPDGSYWEPWVNIDRRVTGLTRHEVPARINKPYMKRGSVSGDTQQLTLHCPWFLGVSPLSWAVPLRQHQQSPLVPADKLILVCGTASPQPGA